MEVCSIELLFYLSLNIVIIVLLTFRKFECTHGSPQELETCLTSITTMDSRFPTILAESSKGRRRPVMGHFSEPYERPELKRNPIHNNTTASTRELSGDVTNS